MGGGGIVRVVVLGCGWWMMVLGCEWWCCGVRGVGGWWQLNVGTAASGRGGAGAWVWGGWWRRAQLYNLNAFYMSDNQLTGVVPEEVMGEKYLPRL